MSTSGEFPDTPKGSPGGIRAAARSIGRAGDHFDDVAAGLSGATGALDADWHGWAASAYRSCVTGLSGPVRTAADQFRDCEQAVNSYANALERTQDEVDRLRVQYEQAKATEAAATGRLSALTGKLATAKPKEVGDIQTQMADEATTAANAGSQAAMILRRANEAIDDLHREGQRQAGVLNGTVTPSQPFSLGGAAPLFTGVLGPSFGVPLGGLNLFNGTITVQHPVDHHVAMSTTEYFLGLGFLSSPGGEKTAEIDSESTNIPGYAGYWAMMNGRSPDALEDDNSLINPVNAAAGGIAGFGRNFAVRGAEGMADALGITGSSEAIEQAARQERAIVESVLSPNTRHAEDAVNAAGINAAAKKRYEIEALQGTVAKNLIDLVGQKVHLPPGTSDLLSHVLGNRTAYTHGAISQLAQMQHFLETHGGATGARAAEALSQLITKLGG